MDKYTKDYKQELIDQKPVAVPLGCKAPEPMEAMLNRLISNRFRDLQVSQEQETFEEADDFDVADDYDPNSPWEEVFDPRTGENLGFLDQNRYSRPENIPSRPDKIYERRLDDRAKSYSMGEDNNSLNGSFQGDSVGSDSQRSE